MYHKALKPILIFAIVLLVASPACNLPGGAPRNEPPAPGPAEPLVLEEPAPILTDVPATDSTPSITHVNVPSGSTSFGKIIYDVESSGTAPEKRAPYGDRYDIYRMERPFKQDMDYIPDMDIVTANVSIEGDWVYVSIELIGSNPNNELGIHYGVELDTDRDGFGDYIIWSKPPYKTEWSTDGVQVFADKNHDTGGVSAERSDAPFDGDGYETKLFDSSVGDDPDLAWVRTIAGNRAKIQFAFKSSLPGSSFMLGVLSDANLRDVAKMYYNDRFTEAEAGSPEKGEAYYPLKALYAFDNTCREAFGFQPSGYEPLLCPRPEPTPQPEKPEPTEPPPPEPTEPPPPPDEPAPEICFPPTSYVCHNWNYTTCQCDDPPLSCPPPVEGCGENSEWAPYPDCYCAPY